MNCDAIRNQPAKVEQIKEQALEDCLQDCRDSDSHLVAVVQAYIELVGLEVCLDIIAAGNNDSVASVLGFDPETGEEEEEEE